MSTVTVTPSVMGLTRELGPVTGVTRIFGSVTPFITGETVLQGVRHSVCHRCDSSSGSTTSIFAFLNLNPCNVIVILVTLSLF